DVKKVQQQGLAQWIEAQLNPQTIDDSAVEKKLAAFKTLQTSAPDLMLAFRADRTNVERKLRDDKSGKVTLPDQQRQHLLAMQQQTQQRGIAAGTSNVELGELINAKLVRAVESDRQLQEVLVDFWSNHF